MDDQQEPTEGPEPTRRENALRSLALSLDIPPEVFPGSESSMDQSSPTVGSVPPPPVDADITEALRWVAAVSAMAGLPDRVEIATSGSEIRVYLGSVTLLDRWLTLAGATPGTPTKDSLGVLAWAMTTNTALWEVTVYHNVLHPQLVTP